MGTGIFRFVKCDCGVSYAVQCRSGSHENVPCPICGDETKAPGQPLEVTFYLTCGCGERIWTRLAPRGESEVVCKCGDRHKVHGSCTVD